MKIIRLIFLYAKGISFIEAGGNAFPLNLALTLCVGCFFIVLTSCGSSQIHAPVYNKHNQIKGSSSTAHTVRLGDTLYSIAWQNGKDFRDLAKWNNISRPYIIYKGQRLSLVATKGFKKRTVTSKYKLKKQYTKQKITRESSSGNKSELKFAWQWPIRVKKLEKGLGKSGVVLIGKRGELVRSSENGKVVYAGNGLKGYGNLLIVMHANEFLTAYGYNKRLLLKEGTIVKKGQAIAEMGTDNKKRPALFFEMRRFGKAVSVTKYLPKIGR